MESEVKAIQSLNKEVQDLKNQMDSKLQEIIAIAHNMNTESAKDLIAEIKGNLLYSLRTETQPFINKVKVYSDNLK